MYFLGVGLSICKQLEMYFRAPPVFGLKRPSIKNGDFPWQNVSSPEGINFFYLCSGPDNRVTVISHIDLSTYQESAVRKKAKTPLQQEIEAARSKRLGKMESLF